MRASTLLTASLATSVLGLGLELRRSDADDASLTFDVPGASEEKGFQIPDGIPDGAYEVTIDDDGIAHHTRLRVELSDVTDADASSPSSSSTGLAARAGLVARQSAWSLVCGDGRSLNKGNTDAAVTWLRTTCSNGVDHTGGRPVRSRLYTVVGDVVAYFCNYDSQTRHCKNWEVTEQLQTGVGNRCGAYKPGWAVWDGRMSIGQQWVDADRYFCGENHRCWLTLTGVQCPANEY